MIRFDYQLRSHGWAVAVVANESSEISLRASYLSDALRDFVDAVQSLFIAETAECVWEEEPGRFCWKFRRAGLRCFAEVFRDNEEKAIFSADDDLLHFSSGVETALQKLLGEWGEDRYFKQWGYAFPKEAHHKLRSQIKTERSRRKTANPHASSED
jgi:hypothetical protein